MLFSKSAAVLAIAAAATSFATLPAQAQRRESESAFLERFDVRPGGMLRIDVPDGDVTVDTWTEAVVEVEVLIWSRDMEWARDVFERMDFAASAEGNTVRITARNPRIRRPEWTRNRSFSLSVRVKAPQRFDADISTADGDIVLGDLNGSVWLDTSDGDVDLGNVLGDETAIETSDGDVTAVGLNAATTTIRTSDGDIDIESVSGRLEATTSDGDIRVYVGAVSDVRLRTGDGDITLYVPSTFAATVDLDAEDLSVSRSFEISGRISRRRIRGEMNGGGARLEASTGDGSISLRPRSAR